ncbi:MAG TPA: cytochrome c oxidase assembly protein [Streptosporangiaceae bacterium]|jgi:putative copper resistance protein D|nr:cytochrome c oxidase assembly protein [Streptosporangiaceae bacterium]
MLPPFGWQAALEHWEFAPVVTAFAVVAAALYLWGAWRVAKRHPARPWPLWRTGLFLAGLAVMVVATESGIGAYDDVLFWDHMIQHLMLIMIAPALLVVGQPFTLLLHASRNPLHTWAKRAMRSRVVSFLTWPPFTFVAYAAAIVSTHLTGLTKLTLANPVAHDAEHALYLFIGYLFFLPILGREPIRWRISYPIRFILLVLAMPIDTFTGLVLGYANTPVASPAGRPPGSPSLVEDAHLGGAVMWIGGDALMLVFMMLVFLMWARDDSPAITSRGWLEAVRKNSFEALVTTPGETPGPAGERNPAAQAAGGIDDDEHLDAYNAYLARLNDPKAH